MIELTIHGQKVNVSNPEEAAQLIKALAGLRPAGGGRASEPSPYVSKLLKTLAANPDKEFTSVELATSIGVKVKSLGPVLGQFAILLRSLSHDIDSVLDKKTIETRQYRETKYQLTDVGREVMNDPAIVHAVNGNGAEAPTPPAEATTGAQPGA